MNPRRDWSDARRKIEDEGRCRLCSATGVKIDAAHVLGRRYDRPRVEGSSTKVLYVHPDSVVGLCSDTVVESSVGPDGVSENRVRRGCHSRYDAGEVSILAVLTVDEQVRAVQDAGGIELARRRIDAPDYSNEIRAARAAQRVRTA
jgi:hypothetical protein